MTKLAFPGMNFNTAKKLMLGDVTTLSQLTRMTERQVCEIPGIGPIRAAYVRQYLDVRGLTMKIEPKRDPKSWEAPHDFKVGDAVRLKKKIRLERKRHPGDHVRARIESFYDDIEGGVRLTTTLRGHLSWNVTDLEKVK